MNPLARWNQLRWNQLNELQDLKSNLANIFNRSRILSPEERVRVPQWIPPVDVSEDARGYVIKAELPQVKRADVKITLEYGKLILTGERKFDRNSKKDHPLGLTNGCFAYSFAVPNDARHARVSAVFKNGLLTVHLTRNAKARRQQLKEQSFVGRVSRSRHRRVPVTLSPFFLTAKTINKNELRMKTQLNQNNSLITGNRMTQFAFPAPTAQHVSLVADFNNWDTKAGPMHKEPNGVWHLGVALKPGRYEYRFFADEVWCDDPAALQKATNSMGTENCVRTV